MSQETNEHTHAEREIDTDRETETERELLAFVQLFFF